MVMNRKVSCVTGEFGKNFACNSCLYVVVFYPLNPYLINPRKIAHAVQIREVIGKITRNIKNEKQKKLRPS